MAKPTTVYRPQQRIEAERELRRKAYKLRDLADNILQDTLAGLPVLNAPELTELTDLSEAMSAYNQALQDEVKVVRWDKGK